MWLPHRRQVPAHIRPIERHPEEKPQRRGIGITSTFSYHFQAALERGALTSLLDEFQPATLPVNLVYTGSRFLPIKMRAFLDFAAPRLRQVFAQ